MSALKSGIVVLAMLATAMASGAQSDTRQPTTPPADGTVGSGDEALAELDEVQVLGQQPVRNPRAMAAWLRRLPGRYRSEGTVTYAGGMGMPSYANGRTVPATGASICLNFGKGPGVQCTIQLSTPDGGTNLEPGMILLGLDIERPLIRYMSVDDLGNAVGDVGELRGNTARFRTPCKATGTTDCFTTTWINAEPDSAGIYFRMEIELNGRPWARFDVEKVRER